MSTTDNIFDVQTHAAGPEGRLPLNPDFLTNAPSRHIFGWTQDAAMGCGPVDLGNWEIPYAAYKTQNDGGFTLGA